MDYSNSPLNSIYSIAKEIYSLLSSEEKVLWEEDPIKGTKFLLMEIRGMLEGSIERKKGLVVLSNGENDTDSLKTLHFLYSNGFDINDETIEEIDKSSKIDRYTAKQSDIFLLGEVINALLEGDKAKIEEKANEYAAYYFKKMKEPQCHSPRKRTIENADGNFSLKTIVDEMVKNGVKISGDGMDVLSQFVTTNPALAKSDSIRNLIGKIIAKVSDDKKMVAFFNKCDHQT